MFEVELGRQVRQRSTEFTRIDIWLLQYSRFTEQSGYRFRNETTKVKHPIRKLFNRELVVSISSCSSKNRICSAALSRSPFAFICIWNWLCSVHFTPEWWMGLLRAEWTRIWNELNYKPNWLNYRTLTLILVRRIVIPTLTYGILGAVWNRNSKTFDVLT